MSAIGWLLLGGLLLALVVALILARPWLVLAMQAHRDFQAARGTAHRRAIETGLARLEQRIAERRAALARLDASEQATQREAQAALHRALADHLIATRLDDVPGVGASRVAALRQHLYRGSLRDLLRADEVPGIGPQTAAAIAAWVQAIEAEWPRLLHGDFPGKTEIERETQERLAGIARERAAISHAVDELAGQTGPARQALEWLRDYTPRDFRRSLRAGGADDGGRLRRYVLGVFPPWEAPPRWYVAVVEGGAAPGE